MTRAANERMQTEGKKKEVKIIGWGGESGGEERVVKEEDRRARGCGESTFCGLRLHQASTNTSEDTLFPKRLSGGGNWEPIGPIVRVVVGNNLFIFVTFGVLGIARSSRSSWWRVRATQTS